MKKTNELILACKISVAFLLHFIIHGNTLYSTLQIKGIGKKNTLFICAHPDDESLFFYKEIMARRENAAVICLSNQNHPIRSEEFKKAMETYSATGIMCDFPDNAYLSWVWKLFLPHMLGIVKRYTQPELIFTHNCQGDYGHTHHILTHECVKRIFVQDQIRTTDDVKETSEEKRNRCDFLEAVYESQDLRNWFPMYF